MAQSYRVAVVGNLDESQGYFHFVYGLQVFDLSTDQICRLMEKPNIEDTKLGATPAAQYSVTGGRLIPTVSREELAQALRDVEVVIIMIPTGRHLSTHTAQEFINYMFHKNLAEKCWYVVVRITSPEEGRGCIDIDGQLGLLPSSQEKVDQESIMRLYGLKRGKIKAKVLTIFDEAKLSKKKSKEGQTVEDPIKMGIDRLRSELNDEEIRKAVTQPVKETISAGKSLVETFRSWLGPLITASTKSQ